MTNTAAITDRTRLLDRLEDLTRRGEADFARKYLKMGHSRGEVAAQLGMRTRELAALLQRYPLARARATVQP